MTWHRVLISRVRALFNARRLDRDLDDELRSHLEMETEANLRRGMSPAEARAAALREFGGLAQTAETYREGRGLLFLENLFHDLRYGLRTLRKSPAFAAVAILSLALGIGANTAIFTLADQVLLRRLPVRHPEELVRFDAPGPGLGMQRDYPHTLSYPMYRALRDQAGAFQGMIARFGTVVNLTVRGQTERVACDLVSGNYFHVLGVRPYLGRLFTPDDDRKRGAHPLAILSYDFWRRRFGGDPSIVGRTLTLNQTAMTVIGVSAPGFRGIEPGSSTDVMVPLMMKAQMVLWWPQIFDPRQAWLDVFARLRPGLSPQSAESAVNLVYRNTLREESNNIHVAESLRQQFLARRLQVLPGLRGYSGLRQTFDQPLKILLALVGLVLLIACANLAGLLSARAAARRGEFALRLALGGSRRRLVRQLMLESSLLALAGGALALPLAWWTASSLVTILPFEEATRGFQTAPDPRALLFTLAVSCVTVLLFGLIPALEATRPVLISGLKSASGGSEAKTTARFRHVLVTAQVAFCLLLTIAAGLFARTLYNFKTLDLGFPKDKLIVFGIDPALNGYKRDRIRSFLDDLEARLRSTPGVRGVAVSGWGPVNETSNIMYARMEGYNGGEDTMLSEVLVRPGALAGVGLPLLAGREFTAEDQSRPVAIVTESIARRYYGGRAVGRHIGNRDAPGPPAIEIVGVAHDVTPSSPRETRPGYIFMPLWEFGQITFQVRTAIAPEALFDTIRKTVRAADPALPIIAMKTMDAQMETGFFLERMIALLSAAFGLLALVLAALGLYGVIAWSVARRTREMGIRLALGASNRDVLRLVMRDVAWMAGAGLLLGFPAALALGTLVRGQLYGVQPADPPTLVAAGLLLASVAFVSGFIPARRALRADLVRALRYE